MMPLLSQRIFERLKQRIIFAVSETSKNEDLKSGMGITFAVAMATFFVCDVHAIEALERK
jgi:hypothetical protein